MGKLLKYEVKKDYKYYLGMYIIILLINIAVWIFGRNSLDGDFVLVVVLLTSIVAYITTFTSVIKSYRNDLHENTGYLLFTVPRTGNQILGSKLIVGMMWLIITTIATISLSSICAIIRYGMPAVPKLNISWDVIAKLIGYGGCTIISILFMTAYLLLMIYFSITISKITLRNRKGGGAFGFLVFILLSILLGVVSSWIIRIFPQYLYFGGGNGIAVHQGAGFNIDFDGSSKMNIAEFIFSICSFIGLFMGAGWMLENKVDM